jgi:hypothetical protein
MVELICRERGIPYDVGRAAFADFIKALHEIDFKAQDTEKGDLGEVCLIDQVYWVIGDEAAYHLGGILANHGNEEVTTMLEYLDWRLKRFRTTVERWEMELKNEIEQSQ